MPHKKAKRTVREKLRAERGEDLAPGKESLRDEDIPKSALRVFNAQAIRDEYKSKKRKAEDSEERGGKKQKLSTGKQKTSLRIQPGESMQHFNRRVEDDLRPLVKSAMQTSLAVSRNVSKAEREARLQKKGNGKSKPVEEEVKKPRVHSPPLQEDKFVGRQKEFQSASSSAPRRLNDIAQAPPELKKLPRGATKSIGKRDGVLSMSQKVMMEAERQKAIMRYRQLKADRRQTGDVGDKLEND
ncbi:hypothetical protein JR316_0006696 [Psilocybe cubensis]|uniref:Uncharacterized protein n=2 Tax=Psilocybe cubensis TaxID=181762 RepID=A0ACB8GWY0_PSICU|nr:hypothetical protein JR316_0006696 [Psilocybe cubensis]KAH9480099.1 hypothetical protein JR316_0006696 [Psilocybe cubensis]